MGLFAGTKWEIPIRCERCDKLEGECRCPPMPKPFLPPSEQTAKLSLEKRKKGKMVSVVRGLDGTESDLPALLTRLKNACGAGGTLQESDLEIQGDHVQRLKALLTAEGYRVK